MQKFICDICGVDIGIGGAGTLTRILKRQVLLPYSPASGKKNVLEDRVDQKQWDFCSECVGEAENFIEGMKRSKLKLKP